jgi:hypothetical protein
VDEREYRGRPAEAERPDCDVETVHTSGLGGR